LGTNIGDVFASFIIGSSELIPILIVSQHLLKLMKKLEEQLRYDKATSQERKC